MLNQPVQVCAQGHVKFDNFGVPFFAGVAMGFKRPPTDGGVGVTDLVLEEPQSSDQPGILPHVTLEGVPSGQVTAEVIQTASPVPGQILATTTIRVRTFDVGGTTPADRPFFISVEVLPNATPTF